MNHRLLGAVPFLIASAAIGSPSPPDRIVPPASAPPAARKPASTDPGSRPARVRVFVDPRTGLWWEPGGSQALAPAGLMAFEVLVHPDGTRSVDLQDAFTVNAVVRRNPDGSTSFACVPGVPAETTSPPPALAKVPASAEK